MTDTDSYPLNCTKKQGCLADMNHFYSESYHVNDNVQEALAATTLFLPIASPHIRTHSSVLVTVSYLNSH